MFRKLTSRSRKRQDSEPDTTHRTPSSSPLISPPNNHSPSPSTTPSIQDGRRLSQSPSDQSSSSTIVSLGANKATEDVSRQLGLNVVYCPRTSRVADIVFIHGLGGTSRSTWSKSKDPDLFWPLRFLATEPELSSSRILTFGYNATFRKAGAGGISLLDFAKDLLFDLKYAKDDQKEDLNMGKVPLVFVVHSMGGLIVKEAYMQGQNDPDYEAIIKSIAAITFLATPHRGTNLAQALNRILQSTLINNAKLYVAELTRNSPSLQKLNEQFRHVAPKLEIVSFYETQPTAIGLKNNKIMVLEKDSSILGYPGETSRALDADHQNICKYDSPEDPNYIVVRNILTSVVAKILSKHQSRRRISLARETSHDLKTILAITEPPVTDYSFFRDQWSQGTSDWILNNSTYREWRYSDHVSPAVLWVQSSPGKGKSVLASYLINTLAEEGCRCQYFFIRFGDRKKRTLSYLLRSLAYQIAQSLPEFLEQIIALSDESIQFETADSRTIWEQLFKISFFGSSEMELYYWVIDGLDEADDSRAFLRLLADVPPNSPLRVVMTSRKTVELETAFQKLKNRHQSYIIDLDDDGLDIEHYIRQELAIPGSVEFKESLVQRLLQGAQNNFLWIRLAVEQLNRSRRQVDIEVALEALPAGMAALYDRMASSIVSMPLATDVELASTILKCVACSQRVLTVEELVYAVGGSLSEMLDLQQSILDLCHGFVVIDNESRVSMMHKTASEYLLGDTSRPLSITPAAAHQHLFLSCMQTLTATGIRAKLSRAQKPEFFDYASTMWSFHLSGSPIESDVVATTLSKFVASQSVLNWIYYLAITKQLRALVQASKNLSSYSSKRRDWSGSESNESQDVLDVELFNTWAVDLIKLAGKFGRSLRNKPDTIFRQIPPLCPHTSSIYQTFGKTEARSLSVSGLSTQEWDDSLARITFGEGVLASSIAVTRSFIAILTSPGQVFIYDSTTFEESPVSPIEHGERLYKFQLNTTGTILVTYGYRTTKLWKISTGTCIMSVANPDSKPRPLDLLFSDKDRTLLLASDDRKIRSIAWKSESTTWEEVAAFEEPELEGHITNAPKLMSLNQDGSCVAIAYRNYPLSAWETDGSVHIGHCWRRRDTLAKGDVIHAAWLPHSPEVLGLYMEGIVFKWRPYDDETEEIAVGALRLALTNDGNLFATGDGQGTIKVFTTASFTLLYQLASPDTVFNLTFSPDSTRIYDIRGAYGNIWEPNALVRYVDATNDAVDSRSETGSIATLTNANIYKRIDSVTVIAYSPQGSSYAYGTENGCVYICRTNSDEKIEVHTSKAFLTIERLTWSNDGQLLCFSDSSRKLTIKTAGTDPAEDGKAFTTVAEISMKKAPKGAILRIQFQPEESQILVQTRNALHFVSLGTLEIRESQNIGQERQHWMVHPLDPARIIGLTSDSIRILDKELNEMVKFSLRPLETVEDGEHSTRVLDRVLVTAEKSHLLLQFVHTRHKTSLLYLNLNSLVASMDGPKDIILSGESVAFTSDLASQVAKCLAFLPRQRLVFVSKNFSVCSVQFPSGQVKNHFVLPGDWITRDSLELCTFWPSQRAFLCPKNGEIAVVKCAALA